MEDLHMCGGWDDDHNCTSFLTCQEIYGARTFYIDTNFSTSSVTFGGGSGTHQDDGIYAFDYTIQKGVNNIQIVADTSVPYRRNASGCNGCKFDDSTADGTSSLSMVVYGVEVVPLAQSIEVGINDLSLSSCDVPIKYDIQPHEYKAGSYGRIVRQVNPDGSWIRYEYDAQGRMVAYDYQPVDPDDSNDARDTERPRTV